MQEQQTKSPLCASYLMGLAPPTWTAAWPRRLFWLPFLFSFFSSNFLLLCPAACVCVCEMWEKVRENICVDPPAFTVIFMVLFVFLHWFQLSQAPFFVFISIFFCLSHLCRHIKWRGHSWSQWTRTTPQTTTGLSRNQWVSALLWIQLFKFVNEQLIALVLFLKRYRILFWMHLIASMLEFYCFFGARSDLTKLIKY